MDHTTEQIPKTQEYPEEIHRILPISGQYLPKKLENYIPAGQQVHTNNPFPYRDYRNDQNRAGCQQTRFDETYNGQYSPNYNYNHYQPFPLVSIAGPDLSTTLINLANIQSRSLDLMVANQKSQQDVYNELTRANKDKANEAMKL